MASCDPTSNKLLVTYLQIDNHIGILSGKQNKKIYVNYSNLFNKWLKVADLKKKNKKKKIKN